MIATIVKPAYPTRAQQRAILGMEFGDALAFIEREFGADDPAEIYWDLFEADEMRREMAEEF